jgi:GntR family transcriptional regulator
LGRDRSFQINIPKYDFPARESPDFTCNIDQSNCTLTVVQLEVIVFKLNPQAGQPLYVQLMQQIRHAVDTGVLQCGDQLPGIRTLAEEIVVSHNTVAKAYSELAHDGLLEIHHGSGAFISAKRSSKSRSERVRVAKERVHALVEALQDGGFSAEEIRRLFEAELFYPEQLQTDR